MRPVATLPVPAQTPQRTAFGPLALHPAIAATASTHMVVDAYANLYAPLLPLLIPRLGLSLAMAGTLAMALQLATSFSQLGWGALADRWRPRTLLVCGPILCVAVMSTIGAAWSPLALACVLVAGGLGNAAFHPPAAALVYRVSDHRKGLAMSVHITGGSIGQSLAPVVFVPAIAAVGLGWSWLVAVPGLLALAFTLRILPPIAPVAPADRQPFRALVPYAKPLGTLFAVIVLRTMTSAAFATFLPVALTRQGLSLAQASAAVSAYLFFSSIGSFAGGPLADRFGPRPVILWSLIVAVPFLAAAPLLAGWKLAALAAVGGLLLQSTLPVNVTYGQQLAPVSAATVSSLMMGFAWGTGSLIAPVAGLMADRVGLGPTLLAVAGAPLVAAGLAATLPDVRNTPPPDVDPEPR
jgi:FSR family fosmidomycin resistance protein-like MFS transporter